MKPQPPVSRIYDLRCSQANLWAVVLLCILGPSGPLAPAAATRSVWFASGIPVDREKVSAATERIDPNTASVASLRRLGGIGPMRAQMIVQYRQTHGPAAFRKPKDLQKVHGIGPGTVRRIEHFLKLPNDLK